MKIDETITMYPLVPVLGIVGVTPAAFDQHLYKGVLGVAVVEVGEMSLAAHLSLPMRATGVVRGGGRFITLDGAICLGVFFSLVSGGVPSPQALRVAQTFSFLGETGNGLRAFKRDTPRPAGKVFPGFGDTILVAISDAQDLEAGQSDGFAFVPGRDLTARNLAEWLGLHEADSAPVCLVNLSELIADIRAGLEGLTAVAIEVDYLPAGQAGGWPEPSSDPIAAFLAECAVRDPWGRTPTRDFYRAFSAWYAKWPGAAIAQDSGKTGNAVLQDGLSALGVRKMKSNGNMTFAGFRWRDTPTVRALLAMAPAEK